MRKLIILIIMSVSGFALAMILSALKVSEPIIYVIVSVICSCSIFLAYAKANNDQSDANKGDKTLDKEHTLNMSLELANASKDMYLKTNQLYNTSERVFKASGNVIDFVQKDNRNILEIDGNIKAVSGEIDEINVEAVKTENISESNIQAVNLSGEKITSVFENMERLMATNNNFSNIVDKLIDSSKAVHNIVGYMDEVADRTNLLSLNASIEAARAGESGKGFMIITKEIKKLADQSREFSTNIKKIIDEIEGNLKSIEGIVTLNEEKIRSTGDAVNSVQGALKIIVEKSSILHENITKVLKSSNRIKELSNRTLEKADILIGSHNDTLELMKNNSAVVNEQWSIVEDFKKITEIINSLSDVFLTSSIGEGIENRLIEIGIKIMNYSGEKSSVALKKLSDELGVTNIFYANKQGIFEYGTIPGALGLNIFELDKRYMDFIKSDENARPYPLSRNLDNGELQKFMAVKRIDAEGVISVGIEIDRLIKL